MDGGSNAAVTVKGKGEWKKLRELAPFLTSNVPSMRIKGQVYMACIRSCLLYGCETWAMRAELE